VKIALKVVSTEVAGTVTKVTVGSNALVAQGDMWVSQTNLMVGATDGQEFDVMVEVDGQSLDANPLVLNNLGGANGTVAGNGVSNVVRGITFDTDDGILYFSDPFRAQIRKYSNITGGSELVYQGTVSPLQNDSLSWPIAVDSANNTLYALMDSFAYSGVVGDSKYNVSLLAMKNGIPTVYADKSGEPYLDENGDPVEVTPIGSTKNIILDLAFKMSTSVDFMGARVPSLYSLDLEGDYRFQRWSIGGDNLGFAAALPSTGDINRINNVVAFAFKPKQTGFTLIREGSGQPSGDLALGEYSLMDVVVSSGILKGTRLATLTDMNKPTAILYNRDGTHVYIADTNRIWLVNMTNYTKEIVSSSNILDDVKGKGSRIGSKVTAMALHPTLNYLYLAADSGGIVMVDLATGDRITIAK
jgi:hypothetical protein